MNTTNEIEQRDIPFPFSEVGREFRTRFGIIAPSLNSLLRYAKGVRVTRDNVLVKMPTTYTTVGRYRAVSYNMWLEFDRRIKRAWNDYEENHGDQE